MATNKRTPNKLWYVVCTCPESRSTREYYLIRHDEESALATATWYCTWHSKTPASAWVITAHETHIAPSDVATVGSRLLQRPEALLARGIAQLDARDIADALRAYNSALRSVRAIVRMARGKESKR